MSLKRKIHGNEWADALNAILKKRQDDVPKGWLTSAEVQKKLGISRCQTQKNIRDMIDMGIVEAKKFKVSSRHGTGLVRPTMHYRILKNFPAIKK